MNNLKLFYRNNKKLFTQTFYIGFAIGAILMIYLLSTGKIS